MIKQLREVGALLGLDCGDNSCYFAEQRDGMRTNGGCRCDLTGRVRELMAAVRELCALVVIAPHEPSTGLLSTVRRVRELMIKAGVK